MGANVMIRLTNAETRRIVRLLDKAQAMIREHAAEQSYRRDACRFLRERILTDYHQRQVETAHETADALTETGGDLLMRLDAAADPAA